MSWQHEHLALLATFVFNLLDCNGSGALLSTHTSNKAILHLAADTCRTLEHKAQRASRHAAGVGADARRREPGSGRRHQLRAAGHIAAARHDCAAGALYEAARCQVRACLQSTPFGFETVGDLCTWAHRQSLASLSAAAVREA